MIRPDLSTKLIHLTRTVDRLSAAKRFNRILAERKLAGSDRDVRGSHKVVAFTESPISMLANVLAMAAEHKMRCSALGVMVDKLWLYERGARPVIYERHDEYEDLPESKQHLHVRYEPDRTTDYCWEREWRVRCETLELDPRATTVIVPTRKWEAEYHRVYAGRRNRRALLTHGLGGGGGPDWHFVALEDLGVSFDDLELDEPSFENVR
jgi:hypothetical protein